MLRLLGGASVLTGAEARPAVAERAPRPWAATGSMAVDHLVVWAVGMQRAGHSPTAGMCRAEVEASKLTWYGSSPDGCARIERDHMMGARIDVFGPTEERIAPAADLVLLALAQEVHGEMITEWARVGTPPDGWAWPARVAWPRHGWRIEGVEAEPVHDYLGPGRSGASLPVVIVDPARIETARGRYRDWHDALNEFAWRLSTRALGFVVAPVSVTREPWAEQKLLDVMRDR